MKYQIGTVLHIHGVTGTVIGYIQYENMHDTGKMWTEYRLKTKKGEMWLSCDDFYKEYSISRPANKVEGKIGPEWHKVDEGTQVVRKYGGDVDVDPGERASFVEFEDTSEERILSVETWSDGTEYSMGEYIRQEDIQVTGYEKTKKSTMNVGGVVGTATIAVILLVILLQGVTTSSAKISDYLKESADYTYETSVTGNQKQTATVYRYYISAETDEVAKDIITGIDGDTLSVTQKDDTEDKEIAILTKREYCLVYHPEEEDDVVYVQISGRKYNYTSDNSPYRCSHRDTVWYRNHYYSSGYKSDSKSYKSLKSAYAMYSGTTIHNIGNGYFDSYSDSIRQSSINSRDSSSGGLSSGK